MPSIDDLIGQLPIGQLAGRLGIGEDATSQALGQVLPALVGGMSANAQDDGGAASLRSALEQHAAAGTAVDAIDEEDGAKIVGHVFGGNLDQVANQLAGSTGLGGDVVKKLLPMVAPAVMAFLAKQFAGAGSAGSATGGNPLQDALGGLLGGGSGGLLDSVLGGLLGGGRKA